MSKIIAFAGVASALAVGCWLAPWRTLLTEAHEPAPAILMFGGLFTVAIAVLIRD